MKLLRVIALLAAALSCPAAAPWDGTKGHITLTTTSDKNYTHIQVTSSNPGIRAFIVTAYVASSDSQQADQEFIQVISDMGHSVTPTATFACQPEAIKVLSVVEIAIGESQWFTASAAK